MGKTGIAWLSLLLVAASVGGVAACSSSDSGGGGGSSSGDPTSNPTGNPTTDPTTNPTDKPGDPSLPPGVGPRAVTQARTTTIPTCTIFVDAAASAGSGTADDPFKTIGAAVGAVQGGGVICVAEGTYAEKLAPGSKYFTLAGGFQAGQGFKVRDSAAYVSKAQGNGGAFVSYTEGGPSELVAVDGFEITGYAHAISRFASTVGKIEITNNYIHDNNCGEDQTGAAFSLSSVTGKIARNVIQKNACGRGGGGALFDNTNSSDLALTNNLVDGNKGTNVGDSHGGGLYLFGHKLSIIGNEFVRNEVKFWGGGLYVGSSTSDGIDTTATLAWNYYHDNKAGAFGGGSFCDDAATCFSDHEVFNKNCGGNVYVDAGYDNKTPTTAKYDHLTSVNALDVSCSGPGYGFQLDKEQAQPDSYEIKNSIFFGNGKDFRISCQNCNKITFNVTYSMITTSGGIDGTASVVKFGDGNVAPSDPLFVDPGNADFHLKSTHGHWTSTGQFQNDSADSPALAKGDPASAVDKQAAQAGDRTELGAYGNTGEASYVK